MIEDILKPGELEEIGQRLIKVREHLERGLGTDEFLSRPGWKKPKNR